MFGTESDGMHWVLIETGSNQNYIFSTSKQRLQVAASAAIWELGYHWVSDAAQAVIDDVNRRTKREIRFVSDPDDSWTVDDDVVVHVVKASGKASLLVPDRELGVEIVRRVTGTAIEKGSGIDVWGHVSPEPLSKDLGDAAVRLRNATIELERQRYRRPSPLSADPALPFHLPCAYTGRPTATFGAESDGEDRPRSLQADFLFESVRQARGRMLERFDGNPVIVGDRHLGDAFDESSWVGVIHADGNGIGKIFTNLAAIADGASFIQRQMVLSRNLEEITWEALRRTVDHVSAVAEHDTVLPILVGGDDVIVVVDGPIAVEFAVTLSRSFETVAREAIGQPFTDAFQDIREQLPHLAAATSQNAQHLSMAVGLALVKAKHPFHHAVELAEALTSRAKETTRAEGAVAIYALFESAIRDLATLLADDSIAGRTYLGRPLRIDGGGVGTVDELRRVIAEIDTVSRGTVQSIREALTTARSPEDAADRLRKVRRQAAHLNIGLGDMLSAITVADAEEKSEDLYSAESPTTLITALELLSISDQPFAPSPVEAAS
ncbi:MAG: hypothetical protein QM809_15320 [Gordonia sp. (in: high G+C Gram-positive bacteria)]|uniref:Cas10/Cmr2 second palm domain-containing protein n=1 Tax=Gordonia sp. (in: high G+C Gram-positive bacteria) TaxID=84139 RepID=UPI0039E31744